MDLAALRSQAIEVNGLDLTPTEANDLINEAHRFVCVESEWTRATIELGPGVDGQAAYEYPATIHRILKLDVDGLPYEPTSEEQVQALEYGNAYASGTGGFWYSTYAADGTEQVSVYPVPGGGEEISARAVVYPSDLTEDTDTPATHPIPQGDRAILNYVQAQVQGDAEDDVQTRDYYLGECGRLVEQLRLLRNSRNSRKNSRVRVRGINA